MTIRLVQIADLHLGRSFMNLGVSNTLRQRFIEAGMGALRDAVQLAREHAATALLIAGDLFDRAEIDEELVAETRAVLAGATCPVLVSPGNHDAFGPMSVWNNMSLKRLGLPPWPDQTHIFTTSDFTPWVSADRALAVQGLCVVGYTSVEDSPLVRVRPMPDVQRNVLLFHGSLSTVRMDERMTLPFTAEQVGTRGFDYAAIGHYHRFLQVSHDGRVCGAYSGTPVPGDVGEDPHGGVLMVTLSDEGVNIEEVVTYPGRVARLAVHADPPVDQRGAVGRIRAQAAEEHLGTDDVAFVTLTGFSRTPLDIAELTTALDADFAHVAIEDDTEPEVASAGGRVTVESQFVEQIDDQISACADASERAVLQAARRYGLAALRGREVQPPPRVLTSEADEGGGGGDDVA